MTALTDSISAPERDTLHTAPAATRPVPERRRSTWSDSQRRTLSVLCLLAACALGVALLNRPAHIADPPPPFPARYDELKDRIDPNTATVAELAVLPGIGPSKAETIVRFRQGVPAPAFGAVSDLTRVRGIGEITAQKLAPYLYFEQTREQAD